MPGRDTLLAVVREWVVKAENDLKTAAHTLKLKEECPTDTVCFHAQQCVESSQLSSKGNVASEEAASPKTLVRSCLNVSRWRRGAAPCE